MYIKHDNWKEEVQSLITDASLVVMRVGTSPGFMWEVQQVLQHQKPENVLLYFSSSLTPMELDDLYGSFQAITRNVFPVELPQNLEGHRFIRFEESWKPVVFGNMEYTVRSENFLVPRAIRNVFYNNKLQHRLGMALRPFFERQGISVNKGRIFGDLSIALGMYCGGPLIAGFMMARNLSVAEQKHAARIVLSISLLLCLAALTLSHLPSIVGILLQTNQWRAPDFISGTHFVLAVALFYAWRHFPDERVRNQVILGNPRVPAWLIVPLLALVFFVWQILLLTPWTEILDVFKGSFWAT